MALSKNVIFTNVALKPDADGDMWWDGMTDEQPKVVQSWLRTERYADSGYDAAHPNSRFTVPASQCPVIDPQWESKEGVPIEAIIFGGRRSNTVPLVYQSRDSEHGTFVGASMTSARELREETMEMFLTASSLAFASAPAAELG